MRGYVGKKLGGLERNVKLKLGYIVFEKNIFSAKEKMLSKKSVLGSYVENRTFIRVMLKLRLKTFHDTIRDSEIGVVKPPTSFLTGEHFVFERFCVCRHLTPRLDLGKTWLFFLRDFHFPPLHPDVHS